MGKVSSLHSIGAANKGRKQAVKVAESDEPMKNKILNVRIEHKLDDSPDSSYLGEFTSDYSDCAIVRNGEFAGQFCADLPEDAEIPSSNREHLYFLPCNHIPHCARNWDHVSAEAKAKVIAEHGSLENADKAYAIADWKRLEALNSGDWQYIGVIAKAEVSVNGVTQTIRSGGLWGIESDSGRESLAEVEAEELASLREILESMGKGFGKRAIAYAFQNVTHDETN